MTGKNRNLVPTRITDKNGRRTTVHKKPVGEGWAAGSAAAAPASRAAVVNSVPTSAAAGLSGLAALGRVDSAEPTLVWKWDETTDEWVERGTGRRIAAGNALRLTLNTPVSSVTLIPGWNSDGEEPIHPATGTTWDLDGFDAEGFDAEGFNRRGFRADGSHRRGGFYDETGHNEYGNSRKADLQLWDSDRNGFDRWGIHEDTDSRYDPDGYDCDGRNADGFTRDEAATAADHSIDPDLMRSLIDGE